MDYINNCRLQWTWEAFLTGIFLKRLIRIKRIVVNDSKPQSQDSNPGPEKYEKSPRRANTVEVKRFVEQLPPPPEVVSFILTVGTCSV
jgi:hypothetical protein